MMAATRAPRLFRAGSHLLLQLRGAGVEAGDGLTKLKTINLTTAVMVVLTKQSAQPDQNQSISINLFFIIN